jgi:hypothetical protein
MAAVGIARLKSVGEPDEASGKTNISGVTAENTSLRIIARSIFMREFVAQIEEACCADKRS